MTNSFILHILNHIFFLLQCKFLAKIIGHTINLCNFRLWKHRGVSGVLGIVCVVASLVSAGIDDFTFDFLPDFTSAIIRSLFFVVSCSLLSLFGSIWLSRKLFGSRRLNFALHAEQKVEDGFVGVDMAAKAVSYTHLDVYKRQSMRGVCPRIRRPPNHTTITTTMVPRNSLIG